ncbi:hypothetical protein BT96DRAFT_161031 [Gymnopus androsaceus JB14]|uniref:Uncharacterized protein n=1 Tax=Gymnopus androsaceus JB14 TaxID=1447944 RepID=A0A6A4HA61_9AGAR|nr:hypothetical protein BT96DRAFT_161031 [Gymnopus androsaceus JB14]
MKDRKYTEDIFNEYCRLCVEFDKTRFSDMHRASFREIPWPVLAPCSSITPNQVNCQSIRDFFIFVRDIKGSPEQRRLLREARNRYHPDRWASKKVVLSVATELERIHVKQTGLVVSQEINRIFDALPS